LLQRKSPTNKRRVKMGFQETTIPEGEETGLWKGETESALAAGGIGSKNMRAGLGQWYTGENPSSW